MKTFNAFWPFIGMTAVFGV